MDTCPHRFLMRSPHTPFRTCGRYRANFLCILHLSLRVTNNFLVSATGALSFAPQKYISTWSLPVWWRNCVTLWPTWHVCRAVGKICAHGEYISGIQLTSDANTPVGFLGAIRIPYSAFKDRGVPIFPYGSLKAHKTFSVRSTMWSTYNI